MVFTYIVDTIIVSNNIFKLIFIDSATKMKKFQRISLYHQKENIQRSNEKSKKFQDFKKIGENQQPNCDQKSISSDKNSSKNGRISEKNCYLAVSFDSSKMKMNVDCSCVKNLTISECFKNHEVTRIDEKKLKNIQKARENSKE